MRRAWAAAILLCLAAAAPGQARREDPVETRAPENTYRAELVSYPGPWAFQIGRSSMILVSDAELEALADPDHVLNLALTFDKHEASLRQVCERARAAGHRTLILAFDHFFSQYRPGQAGPRRLTPDMDDYIRRIAAVSKFAEGYGLGLELSLLSPLEIGPAYERSTGESGVWLHYRKGVRDPATGAFSVQLWQQRRWVNNKGPVDIVDAGVRAFAFRERTVRGTLYRAVDPASIREVSQGVQVEVLEDGEVARRVRIHGRGHAEVGPLDRVLVVQQYRTPEMDYFSPRALHYLNGLVDRYADAGVKLNGLYADEMHIQQDWGYFGHHDNGEFALRYVSPGLAARFADLYGEEYRDFAKYMVYFVTGQEDTARDLSAKADVSHVFGPGPADIQRTALFRSRYYRLLQDGVVDLFVKAKHHAEARMGHRLEARAHATWAESPTIDYWRTGSQPMFRGAYEYTPNFVWSNTVHQSASACSDYFKWGDFLTGNGNDHTEGGWLDRDYLGLALACSTGILNEVPYSYAAHWGMPAEVSNRRMSLVNTFGAAGSPLFGMVQDMQHRDVDVLMLYPIDLVAAAERFGSWMTQYGYANLVTQDKLLERGKVAGGAIEMAGRRFTTLVATFEPFPTRRLLEMMRDMVRGGGRVIWSGPPPVLTREGDDALAAWRDLAGVDTPEDAAAGVIGPGRVVEFEGALRAVPAQTILTDFVVDRLYPVTPREGTEVVARTKGDIVGTLRRAGAGAFAFLGFRPRDDQSRSLGYESRTWFEVLAALGAYPPTGRFPGANDNTEYLSRTTGYLACRFPDGAVAISPHFRDVEEGWPGGFARDRKQDEEYMKAHPLPSGELSLDGFRVNGHTVTYRGREAVTFRVAPDGALTAFAGSGCNRITVDGRETVFADGDMAQLAWAPVPVERRVPGGAVLQAMVYGTGTIRIPAAHLPAELEVVAEGPTPGSRGHTVQSRRENGALVITVSPAESGRWLYAAPAATGR